MVELILGGNKSGKSDFGLSRLGLAPSPWTLVATGKSLDLAFREQIQAHRASRDMAIAVQETDLDLAGTVRGLAGHGSVLVDSLDFWMFSLQQHLADPAARAACRQDLLSLLGAWQGGPLILVSAEMGLGPLAFDGGLRAFARDLGQLNREIASLCARVYLVVAGLPQQLK